MEDVDKKEMFEAVVEIDETYIGGKPGKDKYDGKYYKWVRGTKKTPVVGVID
jgi:hypothetical protein